MIESTCRVSASRPGTIWSFMTQVSKYNVEKIYKIHNQYVAHVPRSQSEEHDGARKQHQEDETRQQLTSALIVGRRSTEVLQSYCETVNCEF